MTLNFSKLEAGLSQLELIHEGLESDSAIDDFHFGWTANLLNLDKYLNGSHRQVRKDLKAEVSRTMPFSVRAEILKERIRRIVVQENGLYVEFFGKQPEYVSGIFDGYGKKENLSAARSTPAGVLTTFKLAHPKGQLSNRSPCVRFFVK